jgi:hypothetical protein
VGFGFIEGGEDEGFEVAAEFVAVDGRHGLIIDRLVIKSRRKSRG